MATQWFKRACAAVALALAVGIPAAGYAADLKVLSPVAMRGAMTTIASHFEKESGHKLIVDFATAGAVANRVQAGESADVAISSVSQVEALETKARIGMGTRASVARVGIGLFVKSGEPKPTIDTVAAFKAALLSAQSIGYGDPAAGGVSGVHMARVIDRLALGEIRSKIQLFPDSQAVMTAVAKNNVQFGIGLTSDAVLVSGVELAAPFPSDIQSFTEYAAAVVTGTKEEAVAKEFVKYLSSPAARALWKAKGFEPL